jgi:hypothetical protein
MHNFRITRKELAKEEAQVKGSKEAQKVTIEIKTTLVLAFTLTGAAAAYFYVVQEHCARFVSR